MSKDVKRGAKIVRLLVAKANVFNVPTQCKVKSKVTKAIIA